MQIHDITNSAVSLLKQLISTPSFSREEVAAADIIEDYLRNNGYEPHRHGNNVWIFSSHFDESRPAILLDAHIDTVRPAAGWTRDPFTPEICGDELYGLGSNDDGGSLVSLMHAFFTRDSMPHATMPNLIFLASCEEEVSGKGGIESILPLLPPIDFAVVGEPTGMQPAVAEKGLMVIDVTEEGIAGHAAREGGVNAIYKAIDDIAWIRNRHFDKVSPLLGEVKATVTIINAGTQHNVIPAECKFTIDVRSNELYTNQELFDEISSHIQGTAIARSFRLGSSRIDLEHPFIRRATSLGLKPFGSPTLSNQALMSFPSVKIGPGQSSRSHSADEFIRISEIDEAIDLYTKLLMP